MIITTFAQSLHELNLIKDQGLSEVILSPLSFSRFGRLPPEEVKNLSARARELNLKVILEWDILMTENVFLEKKFEVLSLLDCADSLRVQDPGALEWAIGNTTLPLQFIAENGNHNLKALQGWIDHAQGRMERIILSIELSKNVIAEYVKALTVPCELLGFGRILLFYSPRSLLAPLKERDSYQDFIEAVGESEESPHKGFPLVENRHGTFMFHIKEFCLIEYAEELKAMGLQFLRVDLRFGQESFLTQVTTLITQFSQIPFDAFKEAFPKDLMRGFYLVNKTDVLFPKLKNSRLQSRHADYIGEVMDSEKGSHLAILVKNPKGLKKTDTLRIVHPKGEEFIVPVYSLKDAALRDVEEVSASKLALIQYVGGVWVKSQVFYS